jgi:putative DNA primase/helicase
MAINDHFGDAGRDLWDNWSRTVPEKFKERDQDKVWRSFHGSGIRIGTLFLRAQQNGWKEERHHERLFTNNSPRSNGHDTVAPFIESPPTNDMQAATIELVSAKASSYKMTVIKWLWQDRFAIGKLGIIAGLPDEGKGQTLAFIVAQVTNGGEWPMSEGRSPQGNVVIFSDEDDPNDTLVPRFAAAGADLDRIHIIKMVRDNKTGRMFSLISDLEALRRKINAIGDVRLVVIDPISAYLGVGKVDSFRTTDVRAVLTPLTTLAMETKVGVIGVMHFNKKTDVTNALLRISDSLAFGAVARHVYGVIDDAEHERKLFVRAKNNVAAKMKNKTLGYRFGAREVGTDEETGEPIIAPYILWDPEYVDVTAIEAMQAASDGKSPAAKDEAV